MECINKMETERKRGKVTRVINRGQIQAQWGINLTRYLTF